jgi:hypothetical protein
MSMNVLSTHWLMTEIADSHAELELPGVDCHLAVAEIYDEVFVADS